MRRKKLRRKQICVCYDDLCVSANGGVKVCSESVQWQSSTKDVSKYIHKYQHARKSQSMSDGKLSSGLLSDEVGDQCVKRSVWNKLQICPGHYLCVRCITCNKCVHEGQTTHLGDKSAKSSQN